MSDKRAVYGVSVKGGTSMILTESLKDVYLLNTATFRNSVDVIMFEEVRTLTSDEVKRAIAKPDSVPSPKP